MEGGQKAFHAMARAPLLQTVKIPISLCLQGERERERERERKRKREGEIERERAQSAGLYSQRFLGFSYFILFYFCCTSHFFSLVLKHSMPFLGYVNTWLCPIFSHILCTENVILFPFVIGSFCSDLLCQKFAGAAW